MKNKFTIKYSKISFMEIKELKDRLLLALKKADINQHELARRCKVSHPTVNQWLSGTTKSIRGDTAVLVANALNVDLIWLLTGNGEMIKKENIDDTNHKDLLDQYVQIPLCEIKLNKEESKMSFILKNTLKESEILIKNEWFKNNNIDKESCCCIEVPSDSMSNFICRGDLIVLNTQERDPNKCSPNAVFLVGNSTGTLHLHRIRKTINEGFILISNNPSYPQETINKESIDKLGVQIIGRVILKIGTTGL